MEGIWGGSIECEGRSAGRMVAILSVKRNRRLSSPAGGIARKRMEVRKTDALAWRSGVNGDGAGRWDGRKRQRLRWTWVVNRPRQE